MRPLHKIILILLLLVSITCDEPPMDEPQVLTYEQSVLERNLIQLINDYRAQNNLMIVSSTEHISALAYEHNLWMIENHVFSHDYFQTRADNIILVLDAEHVGEILAYNYQSNSSALSAWLNSPPHKDILDDNRYGYIGLAITQDLITNRKYYTAIFAGD